ncbi:MAG TPA: hypothetical protein VF556_17925 [Pyrinomonadaceae bacterium]|jgi:hypothetical protein
MSFLSLLFNIPLALIEPGTIGVLLAVFFGFIVLGSGFFAFVMLRKTVKMAIRLMIVGVILLIAVVGSASFLWFSSSSGDAAKPRPNSTRPR